MWNRMHIIHPKFWLMLSKRFPSIKRDIANTMTFAWGGRREETIVKWAVVISICPPLNPFSLFRKI